MEVDSTSRIAQAQSAAAKAEREAAERVTAAQRHVQEAAREEEKQLEHVRDTYEQRTEAERARGEDYLEAVRNRSYQSISEMRRQAENEKHRIASTSEKDLKETDRRYTDAKHSTVRRGEAELKEATERNYKQQEHERLASNERIEAIKTDFAMQKRQIEADKRDTTATLVKQTQDHRKNLEHLTRNAVEESTEHYQAAYEGAMKQNRDAMKDLNWRASRGVNELRRETTQKLDAYADQKSDPFYRMVNVDGRLSEHADQFVFTAKIPEHEQDRININIRGNELIISGKRKSEETLEVEPGRISRTNSYQSFSENFPLGFPVDSKNMTREFQGDTLVVRIPKKTTYEGTKPKKVAERATLERPNFPKNLPGESELAKLNDPERGPDPQDENTPPSKRRKTGRILA
jgi:HSP20 family molecular chaperone IbpA